MPAGELARLRDRSKQVARYRRGWRPGVGLPGVPSDVEPCPRRPRCLSHRSLQCARMGRSGVWPPIRVGQGKMRELSRLVRMSRARRDDGDGGPGGPQGRTAAEKERRLVRMSKARRDDVDGGGKRGREEARCGRSGSAGSPCGCGSRSPGCASQADLVGSSCEEHKAACTTSVQWPWSGPATCPRGG